MKTADANKTVDELVREYPEMREILREAGLAELLNPAGKTLTLAKGAEMLGIPFADMAKALSARGIELTGTEIPAEHKRTDGTGRAALLKDYLRRLDAGEDIRQIRLDFISVFRDADAQEVARAEQELLKEGTPLAEVQKLCDVYSALFHGKTAANAEEAANAAALRERRAAKTKELESIPGHPLRAFEKENEALKKLLAEAETALEVQDFPQELVGRIRGLAVHYAKKGDLLYPPLKVTYGISGPSDVMWTTDDEIRDELAALDGMPDHDAEWMKRMKAVLKRAGAMIRTEENVLFPNCALKFTEEEWAGIYQGAKDYPPCLGVDPETWQPGEDACGREPGMVRDGEIVLPGGSLSVRQLRAVLNTIPMEITFIDDRDVNRFFNEGPKDYKRPGMAIGRSVYSCHPLKMEMAVRQVLDALRSGEADEVPVWTEKNGKTFLVRYMAVRDSKGQYLGTLELIQNMDFARAHFQKERETSGDRQK